MPRLWTGDWFAYVWGTLPGALLALAAASHVIPESLALGLFSVSFVGLNLMHMGATWARVYVRPGWHGFPIERLWIPALLVLFALSFEAVGGGAILLAVQYFLSFHHALMQNYGLVRVSQRRDRRTVDVRLDLAACLLLPGAALFYRAAAVCGEYSGAPLPFFSTAAIGVVALGGLVAIVAFMGREWRAYRQSQQVDPIGIGVICGTNLIWSTLLVADPHPAMPLYALASGHYIQYLYFVWRAEARDPGVAPRFSGSLYLQDFLRSSGFRYLLALLALGGLGTIFLTGISAGLRSMAMEAGLRPAGALEIPVWAAAMIGVNLEHYWLDHRIWRAPRRIVPLAQAS